MPEDDSTVLQNRETVKSHPDGKVSLTLIFTAAGLIQFGRRCVGQNELPIIQSKLYVYRQFLQILEYLLTSGFPYMLQIVMRYLATISIPQGLLMQDFSRFVPNVHFEQIPIKNLVSNQEYQRPLSQAQVEKAIEDFDLNQINPVKVSRRDGVNYVFNGQHTIEIVATVSGSRETPVWCMIYDSLDYKNEADIFANQMKHVRPLKPYEIFMANIEAGNEQQLVIKRLVESYSLSIGPTKAYGVICAVATLERIYTKYGYHVLDRTLRLCVGTWEGDIDSLGGNILAGVAKMVVAFGDQLRDETFKEKVGFMSVRQLSRIAKERGAGSLGYAEAMLVAYNRKCRYTLRMTKLHSGAITAEDDFIEENEDSLADAPVLEK